MTLSSELFLFWTDEKDIKWLQDDLRKLYVK